MTRLVHTALLLILTSMMLSSCHFDAHDELGPHGRDGRAFFAIDYNYAMPYSYWDNNPRVPANPFFGEWYRSNAGRYDFEYFVSPTQYWYGSYRIDIERGYPGGPGHQAGADGADTYVMLYLDPQGWYEEYFFVAKSGEGEMLKGTIDSKEAILEVEMRLVDISERPSIHVPKFQRSESLR